MQTGAIASLSHHPLLTAAGLRRLAGRRRHTPPSAGTSVRTSRCIFLIRTQAESEDLGAKLGANGRSLHATPGHDQLASVQLDSSLSDTRRHPAMVRRCLLSSGSRVRILRLHTAGRILALLVTGAPTAALHSIKPYQTPRFRDRAFSTQISTQVCGTEVCLGAIYPAQ